MRTRLLALLVPLRTNGGVLLVRLGFVLRVTSRVAEGLQTVIWIGWVDPALFRSVAGTTAKFTNFLAFRSRT